MDTVPRTTRGERWKRGHLRQDQTHVRLGPEAGTRQARRGPLGRSRRHARRRQPDPGVAESIAALSNTAGYPLLAEPTSQLRWGPHAPSAHVPGYDLIARARPAELAPELVLRVGDMPTSKALRGWLSEIEGLRQIVIDPVGDWREPTRRAETVLRADPRLVAEGLSERLKAGSAARRSSS